MKSNVFQKALSLALCLILLASACSNALAAKQPKTAEELGYLPPDELLAEDGKTVKFNDPAVQKALEQQFSHLMEADGTFLKDSLKQVDYLIIGVDIINGNWDAHAEAWIAAHSGEAFTAELEQVDLSVLQFCTQLRDISVIAQRVESLAAYSQSKSKYKYLAFMGGKGLRLDACPSISNLNHIDLAACEVESYEPLAGCKKLNQLRLSGNDIDDISWALQIPKLTSLYLADAPNADLTPLLHQKSFDALELYMGGAGVGDLRWQLAQKCKYWFNAYDCTEITAEIVEEYLTKATSLDFSYTEKPAEAIDFSALGGAKKLQNLYIGQADVKSLSFLAELPKLSDFNLYGSHVEDMEGLFSAPNLKRLWLSGCTAGSWGAFEEPVKAKKLSQISITNSGFSDLSFVSGLSLKHLWLSDNSIADISALAKAKKIEKLSLTNNPITDFSPLTEIKGLKLVQHDSSQTLPELKKVTVVEGNDGLWMYY